MGKQDLRVKSISELRAMAKKAGVKAKSGWKKDDYIKALSKVTKATPKTKAAKKPAPKTTKKQVKSLPMRKKKTSLKKPVAKAAKKPVTSRPVPKKTAPRKAAKKPVTPSPVPKKTAVGKSAKKIQLPAKIAKKPAKKAAVKPLVKPAAKSPGPAKKVKPIKKTVKRSAKKTPVKKTAIKPLELLTIAELRSLAKELKISLVGAQKKADIIAAVSKAKVQDTKTPAVAAEVKRRAEKPVPAVTAAQKKKAAPEPEKKIKAAPLKPLSKPESALPKAAKAVVKEIKKVPAKVPVSRAGETKETIVTQSAGVSEIPSPSTAETTPKADAQIENATPALIEYDRNKIVSMPVTPRRIYVYWQISEDTISQYKGSLNLKVLDLKTNAFFYTPISERVGEHFFDVSPDGEYAIEAGIINYKGEFVNMAQLVQAKASTPVSTPEKTGEAAEEELPDEFFETPESVSSY